MDLMPYEVRQSTDVIAFVIADLTIILIAARIFGSLFEKIKQPRIVGEIIAGIMIGPTIIGGGLDKVMKVAMTAPGMPLMPAVPGQPTKFATIAGSGNTHDLFPLQSFAFLSALGQVALIFYMLLVGLELDRRLLKGKGRQVVTMAIGVTLIPVALGFLCGNLLDSTTWHPEGVSVTTFSLFLGAGLSVTAFPVMARILQEKNLLATEMGAIGVGSAALVTVLMFIVIAAASASAKGSGIAGSVGIKFVYLGALLAALLLVVRPVLNYFMKDWEEGDTINGNLFGALLIGALATGFATDRILGAALVGGFFFGVVIPAKREFSAQIISRLSDPVLLFFLPVFLAVSGLNTDLTLFTTSLIAGTVLFVAMMIIGKWGSGILIGRAVGLSGRDANVIGLLLNCRGLLILVVALIGLNLQVITPQTQLVFVIGAILTTMMTGPLVDYFLSDGDEPPEDHETEHFPSGVHELPA